MSGYCALCGHHWLKHLGSPCNVCWCPTYSATPNPESETAMPENLPRVIDLADAKPGDLIEGTFRDDADYLTVRRVKSVEDNFVHLFREVTPWPIIRDPKLESRRFRLLERPENPLPATPGKVILCSLDGLPGAVLKRDRNGGWAGFDVDTAAVTVRGSVAHRRITDWVEMKLVPADQPDEASLRERVESVLAEIERRQKSAGSGPFSNESLDAEVRAYSIANGLLRDALDMP